MINVNLSDLIIINPDTEDGKNPPGKPQGKEKKGQSPKERTNPGAVPRPDFDDSDTEGVGILRTVDSQIKDDRKQVETRGTLGEAGTITNVSRNWETLASSALSGGSSGLTELAKKLIQGLITSKPKVNWKKELKNFFDWGFGGEEEVLPNRRFLGRGDILYGSKPKEKESVRTLVVAVDTSGSISKKQVAVFLNECSHLCKIFDFDKMIVIYCSDDIGVNGRGGIEYVRTGGKIQLDSAGNPANWASTGGNAKGFAPPFAWCEKNKIEPSGFIYMTDTGANYPSVSSFGISKYQKRVFWFICTADTHNLPPFGRHAIIPIDRDGNFC